MTVPRNRRAWTPHITWSNYSSMTKVMGFSINGCPSNMNVSNFRSKAKSACYRSVLILWQVRSCPATPGHIITKPKRRASLSTNLPQLNSKLWLGKVVPVRLINAFIQASIRAKPELIWLWQNEGAFWNCPGCLAAYWPAARHTSFRCTPHSDAHGL